MALIEDTELFEVGPPWYSLIFLQIDDTKNATQVNMRWAEEGTLATGQGFEGN